MSKSRIDFQHLLEEILGSPYVYFQPPATVKLEYPAIIYSLDNVDDLDANNFPYVHNKAYQVTVIDKNPDSEIAEKMYDLQYCGFERAYSADNLNHFVFRIFY